MICLETFDPMHSFLQSSTYIDFDHAMIQEVLREFNRVQEEVELVRDIYEFVRDRVAHSWDIQAHDVQATASEVLENGHGICYGKSHLLAALLRGAGIPAGFAYQRLTLFDTPEQGYCIHALNTVYLRQYDKWVRLDARGNKPGVDAQFSVNDEQLAFPVRLNFGEVDYTTNYAAPHPFIIQTLDQYRNGDCRQMYLEGLPAEL